MTIRTNIFQNIQVAPARKQLAAVLKMLIENESVSERDTVFNGFRGRISELILEHGLDVRYTEVKTINQFGNPSTYRKHYLLLIEKEKAIELYEKINK